MAFNFATFKTRSLSAILFLVVMLAGLLLNHWSFFILFTIIHFGCWYEYRRLVEKIDPAYKEISLFHRAVVPLLGFCLMLYVTNHAFDIGSLSLHSLGWWLGLLLVLILPLGELLLARKTGPRQYFHSLFGFVYISLSWALMIDLRCRGMAVTPGGRVIFDAGLIVPLVLIASIWINDTMAYIVGSLIGKTPFSPISPKKTWEGTIGGAILAVAVVTLVGYYLVGVKEAWGLIAISSIAAVFGTLGDLFESKLKRMAGVKDSGTILPGHGGFLDRFDSLLFATPLTWLYFVLFY